MKDSYNITARSNLHGSLGTGSFRRDWPLGNLSSLALRFGGGSKLRFERLGSETKTIGRQVLESRINILHIADHISICDLATLAHHSPL